MWTSKYLYALIIVNFDYHLCVFSRTKTLISTRRDLIKQRRETAINTKRQKDEINKVMEQVRTDAAKANKIIKTVMSGNGSISSLTAKLTSPPKSKKNSSFDKKAKTSDSLLRVSKSANAVGSERSGGPTVNYSTKDEGPGPQAYVSPYTAAPADDVQ